MPQVSGGHWNDLIKLRSELQSKLKSSIKAQATKFVFHCHDIMMLIL